MIFLKSLFGGILATCIMWIIIVFMSLWRIQRHANPNQGLTAVAGGWTYLLRLPIVALLLTVAFGLGFYLTARGASN